MAQDTDTAIPGTDRSLIDSVSDRTGQAITILSEMKGGLTNHCYLVQFGQERAVLRINNPQAPGVDRQTEARILSLIDPLTCVPDILYLDPDKALLTRLVDNGIPGLPEKRDCAITKMADCLRQIHRIHFEQSSSSMTNRLQDYARLPGMDPVILEEVIESCQRLDQLNELESAKSLLHRDLNPANILWTSDGPIIIDWEYAGSGHPVLDLASFSAGHQLTSREQALLLDSYGNSKIDQSRLTLAGTVIDGLNRLWATMGIGN